MSRSEALKRTGLRLVNRLPLYKTLPAGKYRDYAAIHYLSRAHPEHIPAYLSVSGRLPDWRYSSLYQSAVASLAAGDDDKTRTLADRAIELHPERAEAHLILAELDEYAGNLATAFRHAQDAWLLDPKLQDAAVKVIQLGHLTGRQTYSDDAALVALERFPRNQKLLWAACKHCDSREQLIRIRDLWITRFTGNKLITAGARALALAALHLEWFDFAQELYIGACTAELNGSGVGHPIGAKSLAGKNGLSALKDLHTVLESSSIPFFFAAGTVLGIVRDGKPLDHDDDIDVGVFQEHWDREVLARIFAKHPSFKVEASMAKKPKIRLMHRSGGSIDIFQFYREGSDIFHDGNFVRWRNSDFEIERHEFSNGDIGYLPSNPDRYLTENYGDWRVPDPDFDAFVDGPNMEVTSEPYWRVHRLRRANKFLRALELDNARKELASVHETLSTTDAGRELLSAAQL